MNELRKFNGFGASTICESTTSATFSGKQVVVPAFVNEYWTSAQRAASSLHEVSYRACFKPQLPRFFIERLSDPGDPVYDPFMGRGTTPVEAALLGRVPVGCDVNPLSVRLVRPRLSPPQLPQVAERL
ncbi:MAG: site-specific DNA-methyltransferase, partial [Verrucomicrobia bacterium]|nr:site-specific DNA-methyltransferase [Verrucomicrobiota bacterium]